jgi:hypothetical protein
MRIVLKIDDRSQLAALINQRAQAGGIKPSTVARMMLFQAMSGMSGNAPALTPEPSRRPVVEDDDNAVLSGLLGNLGD